MHEMEVMDVESQGDYEDYSKSGLITIDHSDDGDNHRHENGQVNVNQTMHTVSNRPNSYNTTIANFESDVNMTNTMPTSAPLSSTMSTSSRSSTTRRRRRYIPRPRMHEMEGMDVESQGEYRSARMCESVREVIRIVNKLAVTPRDEEAEMFPAVAIRAKCEKFQYIHSTQISRAQRSEGMMRSRSLTHRRGERYNTTIRYRKEMINRRKESDLKNKREQAPRAPVVLPTLSELLEVFHDAHHVMTFRFLNLTGNCLFDCLDFQGSWLVGVTKPTNWLKRQNRPPRQSTSASSSSVQDDSSTPESVLASSVSETAPTSSMLIIGSSVSASSSQLLSSSAVPIDTAIQFSVNTSSHVSNSTSPTGMEPAIAVEEQNLTATTSVTISNTIQSPSSSSLSEKSKRRIVCVEGSPRPQDGSPNFTATGLPIPSLVQLDSSRFRTTLRSLDTTEIDNTFFEMSRHDDQIRQLRNSNSKEIEMIPEQRSYENFDIPYLHLTNITSTAVNSHFLGYQERWDESIPRFSRRFAPFRSRTQRPMTRAVEDMKIMEETLGVTSSLSGIVYDERDSIRVRLRCLWLASRPGAGLVRYLVVKLTILNEIISDFCSIMNIPRGRCRVAKIDMIQAIESLKERFHKVYTFDDDTPALEKGVCYLDPSLSVSDAGLREGDTVDIILIPHQNDEVLAPGSILFAKG